MSPEKIYRVKALIQEALNNKISVNKLCIKKGYGRNYVSDGIWQLTDCLRKEKISKELYDEIIVLYNEYFNLKNTIKLEEIGSKKDRKPKKDKSIITEKEQIIKIKDNTPKFDFDIKPLLLKSPLSIEELSEKFFTTEDIIKCKLFDLKNEKYNLIEDENFKFFIDKNIRQGAVKRLNEKMWQGDVFKFGFVSDNHMGNTNERNDVLNLLYDIYASEGIEIVFNGGNWVDGEMPFNKNELHTRGMTKQIEYAVNNYPFRKGIKTKFVAGDDHEGWWQINSGINIGEYFQLKREQAGMFDLEYLGYAEADIPLDENNSTWMRLAHPGGGSAQAFSWKSQRIVDSYQANEKPAVLLLGHYHKLDYAYPREVHVIQMGCFTANTFIETKDGRKRIKDIKVGDEVLTHKNRYKKVTKLYKYKYEKGFTTINFGRKGSFDNMLTATNEHPILIERDGNKIWCEIKDVEIGNYVFALTKKCLHCDNLIPYWMNYCNDYNVMDNPELRKKLSDIKGGFKKKRSEINISDGGIHLHKDIIPFCDEKIKEGWKIVPVGAETIPDAVGYKDGKIVLFELEKSSGTLLEYKKDKYTNSFINKYVDDIKWIDIRPKYKGIGACDYEIDENGFAKVMVVDKKQKDSYFTDNRKGTTVYNLAVEDDESFVASRISVHNCTENQSLWMRKKNLLAHVGGGICELTRAKDGTINRCKVEFITAYDNKFYIGKDKYFK